jgi:hypothetical protein
MVRAESDICVSVVEMRRRRIELLADWIGYRSELHPWDRRRREHPSSRSHGDKQERIYDRDVERHPNGGGGGVEFRYDHEPTADDDSDDDDFDDDFDDDSDDDDDFDDDFDDDSDDDHGFVGFVGSLGGWSLVFGGECVQYADSGERSCASGQCPDGPGVGR